MPDTAFYEVILTGLTHNGKVWSRGELINRDNVSTKVRDIWDNPAKQKERYGDYVVRPRKAEFAVKEPDIPPMEFTGGSSEETGTGYAGKATIGVNPPQMSPDAEVGVSMSSVSV